MRYCLGNTYQIATTPGLLSIALEFNELFLFISCVVS